MLDPELKNYLSGINLHLTELKAKKNPGIWQSFFNGMFSALGYVVGLALVIVILGWVLNATGLLKPFQEQMKNFSDIIDSAKKLIPSESKPNTNNQAPQSGTGESTFTLPDGRQIKVQLPQ